jgi:hypothetical protein
VSNPLFLFRGVKRTLHDQNGGRLVPKEIYGQIETVFTRDDSIPRTRGGDPRDLGAKRIESIENTILKHQLRQRGYPTSGVSTTPFAANAKKYALHTEAHGYIYKIDVAKCDIAKVRVCRVADFIPVPSVPDDEEYVLFAVDGGILPDEIIAETLEVVRQVG